jgi:hypothetical protein
MACFVLYISLYSSLDIVPTGLALSSLLITVNSSNSVRTPIYKPGNSKKK